MPGAGSPHFTNEFNPIDQEDHIVNTRSSFIREQTGDGYIDVAIVILIVFVLMASLLAIFPIFTAQQSLNNTARQIAQTVEVTGRAGIEVDDYLNTCPGMVPDSIQYKTDWLDENKKTIQLKTPFTVTASKKVSIVILRPSFGNPMAIQVQITASASGISEVYWK